MGLREGAVVTMEFGAVRTLDWYCSQMSAPALKRNGVVVVESNNIMQDVHTHLNVEKWGC